MRIKIYIVTYNNDEVLKKNLDSIYKSDIHQYNYSIHVINNYSILSGFYDYQNIEIINNSTRPDFSTGHLSRNWNQAIINGFGNLKNPLCDIVVSMQNDTFVKQSCFTDLLKLHEKFDFIVVGSGDQFMSYNVNAIKKIGIWDERFCSIGYQEGDYFMSAYMFSRDKISINDYAHSRVYNPAYSKDDWGSFLIEKDHHLNEQFHIRDWHDYNYSLFREKWGDLPVDNWNFSGYENYSYPKIKKYQYYPYFEKDIQTLEKQNYFFIK